MWAVRAGQRCLRPLLKQDGEGQGGWAARRLSQGPQQKTAAACIIGNEILTGKVQDVNTYTLAKFCFQAGLRLNRVEVVPDIEEDISSTCLALSHSHDYVFTSGGVGSTHDDITYQSIAKAFGRRLVVDMDTLECLEAHQGKPMAEAGRRMAMFPEGATVLRVGGHCVPVVVVDNVYILPGVPMLFEKLLLAQHDRLNTGQVLSRKYLWTWCKESDMAADLLAAQCSFPKVEIGSYPRFDTKGKVLVMLSFEGAEPHEVQRCVDHVKAIVRTEDTEEALRRASIA